MVASENSWLRQPPSSPHQPQFLQQLPLGGGGDKAVGCHGAADGDGGDADAGEDAGAAEHKAFDGGAAAGEGAAIGGPGGAVAALVHV